MKGFLAVLLLSAVAFAYECIVERVIDGDTFVCSGEKVRLIGVDTPESWKNRRAYMQREFGDVETVVRLGKEAKRFTASLIPPGTRVRLEFDIQRRDRYGRFLAYVWLPNGEMLNEILLREGYATLLTIPPNTKYADRFREAYIYAVENGKGLWAEGGDPGVRIMDESTPVPENAPEVREDAYRPLPGADYSSERRCGAKRYCYQMESCEEAMFYYSVCGLKRLDGDGDGIPCESLCGR